MEKIIAEFRNDKFYINGNYYDKIGNIGKIVNGKIELSYEEILYLLYKGLCYVKYEDQLIENFQEFLNRFLNKINYKEFLIVKYLRDRGYKFRKEDFLIFKINNEDYLVYPTFDHEEYDISFIINLLDLAKKKNYKLLLAIIDSEFDIVFYEIDYLKL